MRFGICRSAVLALLMVAAMPLSAQAENPVNRIAFGSELAPEKAQPVWWGLKDYDPELMVFVGGAGSRQAQEALARNPYFLSLKEATSVVATRADGDEANIGEAEADGVDAREFAKFWGEKAGDALYQSQIFGPKGRRVQMIRLDTRGHRADFKNTLRPGLPGQERFVPDADRALSMLGAAQWQWLEAQLREPADLRVIVSPLPVIAVGHGHARWGQLPMEQRRLFDLLAATGADQNTFFVSDDYQTGALYRYDAGLNAPVFEIGLGAMTGNDKAECVAAPYRVGRCYGEAGFATLDIDWNERAARLALRDAGGAMLKRAVVALPNAE